MATQSSCIWKLVKFDLFCCSARHAISVHLNFHETSIMKDNMTFVIQINVKFVFHKNYEAHKLFKDILYIPGGRGHERIALTDDLYLPSNHTGSFTGEIILGQNFYDMLYLKKIIRFLVYKVRLRYNEVGLSYFWLTLVFWHSNWGRILYFDIRNPILTIRTEAEYRILTFKILFWLSNWAEYLNLTFKILFWHSK